MRAERHGRDPIPAITLTWYDILGVLPGASAEEIRRAADAKAAVLRPELVPAPRPK